MLEISHLTKIYKTKGGHDVKALDDVSIRFNETGMVFLLGKSGSGKSTLLNVCGGLDTPTSGEIIVKGRSSKKFTQSDFDSYRNTFIGFIFQEYNILNEFTVEENIALALELQNKTKDKKAISELLEKVDLSGFAKRKPNTLSGGQKQRIAIARALIKSPKIIMADEPTGALDSVTGRQVLETLKKLSKDTLVIVVSHDREFAETYGDRIIELKDGKIISDISKVYEEKNEISENISVVGNTLCIKQGSKLNEEDFLQIKEFLNHSDSDIIVAKGESDVKKIKRVSRINDNDEKEVFKETNEMQIPLKKYNKEDSNFIRSKLPIRHAIKIGLSSLKYKPIRLFFTIILCTISFVLFGLLSTMTFYDNEAVFKESLEHSNYSFIKLNKLSKSLETHYSHGEKTAEYEVSNDATFTSKEFDDYIKKYGKDVFYGVSVNMNFNVQNTNSSYWINRISAFAYMNEDNQLQAKITGNYPIKDDEICISSYTADVIINNKIYDGKTNRLLELSKKEDVIGKYLTIGNAIYKVVGIIDSGELEEKYDQLLENNDTNYQLLNDFHTILNDELHMMAFVTQNRLEQISKENPIYTGNDKFLSTKMSVALEKNGTYIFPEWTNSSYAGYSEIKEEETVTYFKSGKTLLTDNEIVVNKNLFYQLISEYYNQRGEYDNQVWTYLDLVNQLQSGEMYVQDKVVELTEQEKKYKFETLINSVIKNNVTLKVGVRTFDEFNGTTMGETKEVIVAGVWDDKDNVYGESRILFSDEVAKELWDNQKKNLEYYFLTESKYQDENTMYQTIYLPFKNTDENIEKMWKIYSNNEFNEKDYRTRISSSMIDSLEMIDLLVRELSKVFLYIGMFLAMFSILLFSNFISVSILNKKKEIGILRAVGARSIDVFKIFFSESFAITLICITLSVIGNIVICNLLNQELASGFGVSIFVFGIVSLLILIVIALITAVVATFLPVYSAAKKKPVESIRAI